MIGGRVHLGSIPNYNQTAKALSYAKRNLISGAKKFYTLQQKHGRQALAALNIGTQVFQGNYPSAIAGLATFPRTGYTKTYRTKGWSGTYYPRNTYKKPYIYKKRYYRKPYRKRVPYWIWLRNKRKRKKPYRRHYTTWNY